MNRHTRTKQCRILQDKKVPQQQAARIVRVSQASFQVCMSNCEFVPELKENM